MLTKVKDFINRNKQTEVMKCFNCPNPATMKIGSLDVCSQIECFLTVPEIMRQVKQILDDEPSSLIDYSKGLGCASCRYHSPFCPPTCSRVKTSYIK